MEEFSHSIGCQNAALLTTGLTSPAPPLDTSTLLAGMPSTESSNGHGETANADQNEVVSTLEPFAETLKTYIPEDSILMQSIKERKPTAVLMNEHNPNGFENEKSIAYSIGKMHVSSKTGGSALIIQDIDQFWAERLLSEFPKSVHRTFLAHHMIRLDSFSATEQTIERLEKDMIRNRQGAKLESRMFNRHKSVEFVLPGPSLDTNGCHLDYLVQTIEESGDAVPLHVPFSTGPRKDLFERDQLNIWRRTSTRLSWCRLENTSVGKLNAFAIQLSVTDRGDLDLILVDAIPDAEKDRGSLWKLSKGDPFRTSVNIGIEYPVVNLLRFPAVHEQRGRSASHMRAFTLQLLRQHTVQSVFSPRAIPHRWLGDDSSNASIFGLLLAESIWRLAVSTLETTLQGLRHKATKQAGDEAFPMLTNFRRDVSDVQMLLAESRKRCIEILEGAECWRVDGSIVNAYQFWSQKPSTPTAALSRHAQSIDIRNLPDSLERLESRANAMMQAINEEIQVVIGSVQVEDAKTMKRQTEKMKRQTEWTVVLAVLAAVYLPMTVVTGIFGMNIREMEAQTTMPDRWSVFKAWGVAFGATLGGILVYAAWRWPVRRMLSRRKELENEESDIEALKMQ